MFSMMSYDLPTGWRSLMLIEVPGAEHPLAVLDVPFESPLRASDWRLAATDLDDYFQARDAAQEYYLRSKELGRPAADEPSDALASPVTRMRTLMTYPLPTGGRALVLVEVDDGEFPFTLIEVPAEGPLHPEADCRVVDHCLATEAQAYDVAVTHMVSSERLGAPAPIPD